MENGTSNTLTNPFSSLPAPPGGSKAGGRALPKAPGGRKLPPAPATKEEETEVDEFDSGELELDENPPVFSPLICKAPPRPPKGEKKAPPPPMGPDGDAPPRPPKGPPQPEEEEGRFFMTL